MTQQPEQTISRFDCLAVTQVQVFPFKEGPSLGHIKGIAAVVLNDQFQVRGLRIMEGENGLFVGYPLDPFYKGEEFRNVCCPISRHCESTYRPAYWRSTTTTGRTGATGW